MDKERRLDLSYVLQIELIKLVNGLELEGEGINSDTWVSASSSWESLGVL